MRELGGSLVDPCTLDVTYVVVEKKRHDARTSACAIQKHHLAERRTMTAGDVTN